MEIKSNSKQTYKNIAINILAFMIQFVISFYISPIIVGKVGASAYGFIGLANDFVSYASILASVFNSVAARFIADAFYKKDFQLANHYFNSLIVANTVLAGLLGLVSFAFVPNINQFLTIPAEIMFDVKLTFALIFVSYIITLLTMVFTTSTFVTNRTDIQGIRNIVSHFIRFAIIIVFLNFISVKIYWVSLASLVASTVIAVLNIGLTKKLTPEIHINLRYAKSKYAFDLAKSGCWMAFTSMSVILMRGLDLIIANKMLGEHEMGLLSIARTMPNNITSVIGVIAPLFTPMFVILYSKGQISNLVDSVKKSITTMALILFVPISAFLVFSYDFYALWQKSLSGDELSIVTVLSILTILQSFFNATTSTMSQLAIVTNKLKLTVLMDFLCGILNIVFIYLLIKYANLGLFSIAISGPIIMILRYIVFNSLFAAHVLKQPKQTFLRTAVKTWVSIPVLILTMGIIKHFMPIHSWGSLIVVAGVCSIIGYVEMALLYYQKTFIGRMKKMFRK